MVRMVTSLSVLIGRDDLATGDGRQAHVDRRVDRSLDGPHAAVAHREQEVPGWTLRKLGTRWPGPGLPGVGGAQISVIESDPQSPGA